MPVYYQRLNKQVSAELDYEIDWSKWLETGDTIAASSWAALSGMTEVGTTHTTTTATIIVSGGTIGVTYALVNTITTANGLVDHRTIGVTVISDVPTY